MRELSCLAFLGFDLMFLTTVPWGAQVRSAFDLLGWLALQDRAFIVHPRVCVEFFSTLTLSEGALQFSLGNQIYTLPHDSFNQVVPTILLGPHEFVEEEYNHINFWHTISNDTGFTLTDLRSKHIQDPVMWWLHRFISFNFTGKTEGNKVSADELTMLYCIRKHMRYDLGSYLWKKLVGMNKRPKANIGLGWIVTIIASNVAPRVLEGNGVVVRPRALNKDSVRGITFGGPVTNRVEPEDIEQHEEVGGGDDQYEPQPYHHTGLNQWDEAEAREWRPWQQGPTNEQIFAQNKQILQWQQQANSRFDNLENFASYYCRQNQWPYPPPPPSPPAV
ncbi:hypothetical protein M5689_003344 [Euphorbia peplus]|nr:hypothetical protein M5689_003344 [Euphorbia peplus]